MTRPLPIDIRLATDDYLSRPIFLLELELVDEIIYLTDWAVDLTWSGHTYLANGWFVDLKEVAETTDNREQQIEIILTGAPEEINAITFLNVKQNKHGRVRLGILDTSYNLIGDPYLIYEGRFDYPEIEDSDEQTRITLHYSSRFADLDKPKNIRYTNESQQQMFPGDRGFEYVASLVAEWNGFWGRGLTPPKRNNKSDRKNPPKKTR